MEYNKNSNIENPDVLSDIECDCFTDDLKKSDEMFKRFDLATIVMENEFFNGRFQ